MLTPLKLPFVHNNTCLWQSASMGMWCCREE